MSLLEHFLSSWNHINQQIQLLYTSIVTTFFADSFLKLVSVFTLYHFGMCCSTLYQGKMCLCIFPVWLVISFNFGWFLSFIFFYHSFFPWSSGQPRFHFSHSSVPTSHLLLLIKSSIFSSLSRSVNLSILAIFNFFGPSLVWPRLQTFFRLWVHQFA